MSSELEALRYVAEAAVVRPGDTLVLRLGKDVTPVQLARFHDGALPALKERIPGVEVIIVGGVWQLIVHRPGEAEDGPG